MQLDLERVYSWAKVNNVKFDDLEFIILRFRTHNNMQYDTIYFINEMSEVIESAYSHRDFSIFMSSNG